LALSALSPFSPVVAFSSVLGFSVLFSYSNAFWGRRVKAELTDGRQIAVDSRSVAGGAFWFGTAGEESLTDGRQIAVDSRSVAGGARRVACVSRGTAGDGS
jgi:hypothetical protein